MSFTERWARHPRRRSAYRLEPFPVDVSDRGDAYVLAAVLPGRSPEQLHVSVRGPVVEIAADPARMGPAGQPRERVHRAIVLDEPVMPAAARTTYDGSILAITLPKRPAMV